MHIASLLSTELTSALEVWLSAIGHKVSTDPTGAERLVLDYRHLTQAAHKTDLEPRYWLLLDSQLNTAQTIQALQRRCGYITTAPLQRSTLDNWLAGTHPLEDMFSINRHHQLTPEADPFIGPFVDLLTTAIWDQDKRDQAKRVIIWRDIALQLPQFKQLQEGHKLNPLQQAQLACHTITGAQLLAPNDTFTSQIIQQHHEHFDGSGYPSQLRASQIHPFARLAKLYDSYLGLRRHKTYAKAQSHEISIQKLMQGDGYLWPGQFDPQLLSLLEANASALADLYQFWHSQN
ncbi:MAG: HD domain-containing phosphohydrolase [Gammaproteobacteria bacterium]|jgi:hypothetical protein|nr:HD domain-containing phosphohydrolase [Gammaproteobacteria bacterium]